MPRTRRRPRRPAVVSLLGVSGAGKTTLAAALVKRWRAAGLRVGYVKHASHGFEMDRAGKDTHRLTRAGAAGVAVTGPGGWAYVERGDPAEPDVLVERLFADCDVVVAEGFRSHGYPAVVVLGDDAEGADPAAALTGALAATLAEARGPVLAILARGRGRTRGRGPEPEVAPWFTPREGARLAAHLLRALGVRRRSR